MDKKKAPQRNQTSSHHLSADSIDYGLAAYNVFHSPSSGFGHSEADAYRDERAMNPNVRYVPGENNRDELRQWDGKTGDKEDTKEARSSDDRVFEVVHEVLSRHPEIDVSQVQIGVIHGVVTLEGNVETRRLMRLIEDVVSGLPGIHELKNQIQVQKHDPDRKRIARSLS